jgi:hypothetical protein
MDRPFGKPGRPNNARKPTVAAAVHTFDPRFTGTMFWRALQFGTYPCTVATPRHILLTFPTLRVTGLSVCSDRPPALQRTASGPERPAMHDDDLWPRATGPCILWFSFSKEWLASRPAAPAPATCPGRPRPESWQSWQVARLVCILFSDG